jgi:hypothetical protein
MAETAPTSTTVYQQALPEYAAPYFERLLQRAETESLQPYAPYGGARLSDFSEMEKAAQTAYGTFVEPTALTAARGVAAQVAGAGIGVAPGQVPDAFKYAKEYQPGDFGAAYAPVGITSGYQAGPFTAAYAPTGVSQDYRAALGPDTYQAGILAAPGRFDQGAIAAYMTPYQEQVTSAAIRELEKGAERARTGISQAAAQAGGRGSYREALERSELQRNILEQVGDVTAKGRAAAYESAQQQFERDRQAAMQAFQMQEAAKQAQAQSGLAGYQAREAARQAQAQFGLTAQELGGRQALSAAELAARQEAAREAAKQAQAQFGLTAQQATEQQRLASAELAARQEAAREAARQQATQFGLAGLQQNVAQRQQQLAAAQALSGMGGQEQALGLERLAAKEAAGQRQRAMRQASLDIGYEDFLRQLGYTQGQLGFYSNILRGVPVQPQQTVSTFQQQPSLFQSVLGAGIGGLGLYNALKG